MNAVTTRIADARDRAAIHSVEESAFGQAGEADLVNGFVADGDAVPLTEAAHVILEERGETLSVVLGEPTCYGRFGCAHDRAAGSVSDYQRKALQALAWRDALTAGRPVYPLAFRGL